MALAIAGTAVTAVLISLVTVVLLFAATVILGILGAVVGGFIANAIGVGDTNGIDWIKLIISVIVAAAAVTVYGSIAGKKV